MVSTVKIVPSSWPAGNPDYEQSIREFYETADNSFNEQFQLMNIQWETQTPVTEKHLLKTTKQDKDDDYVRQTK